MIKVIPKILVLVGCAALGTVCGIAIAENNSRKKEKEPEKTEVQTA